MLEILLFPNPIMFLNIKIPILKQLDAFTSLSTCVLQTASPFCAHRNLCSLMRKGLELINCGSKWCLPERGGNNTLQGKIDQVGAAAGPQVPYISYRWNLKLQETQSTHQHQAMRNFHGLAYSWGIRECHRIQLQWEYVTRAVWAHKARIREPVHVFNAEPFITFNTKGSFL